MQVRALLNAPLKSRFEEFDISVREAIYKSQQNEQLGMPRKPWTKPDDVTNFSRTFGDPSGSGEYFFLNVTLFYRINTKINSGSYQIQKFTRSFYLRMCQSVSKMSGEPVPFQSAVISMTKLNNFIIIVLMNIYVLPADITMPSTTNTPSATTTIPHTMDAAPRCVSIGCIARRICV